MRNIFLLGTVPCMMPEKAFELNLLLKVMNPDQIFVEVTDNDLMNTEGYMNDEMLFIVEWAKQNGKKIVGHCFATDCTLLLEENRKKTLTEEFSHLIAGNNWKAFNKIDTEVYNRFYNLCAMMIDMKKVEDKQMKMLGIIENKMVNHGKILVVTEALNLKFFEENLKNAVIPLRR
jgi:hypothetical protein